MTYLINLQRAISQTENTCPSQDIEYQAGWGECGSDLIYGVSCGSEHAVQAQMAAWLIEPHNPYFEELDCESDRGYCERIKVVKLFMESV